MGRRFSPLQARKICTRSAQSYKQQHGSISSLWFGTPDLCWLQLYNHRSQDRTLNDSETLQVHSVAKLCSLTRSTYHTLPTTWNSGHASCVVNSITTWWVLVLASSSSASEYRTSYSSSGNCP